MENFLIALGAAAVSGITFLAYKHPDFFQKEFSNKILIVSMVIFAAGALHDTGVGSAHQALIPFLKEGMENELQEALTSAKTADYVYLASLGSLLYGMFLSWLAEHMKKENASNQDD